MAINNGFKAGPVIMIDDTMTLQRIDVTRPNKRTRLYRITQMIVLRNTGKSIVRCVDLNVVQLNKIMDQIANI